MPDRTEDAAEAARAILDFWFGEVGHERWFVKDSQLDTAIASRFARLRNAVLASRAVAWRDSPQTVLAAIILLDQFSRNMHRGHRRAFEADPLARELTMLALNRGWQMMLGTHQRQFLLMPLMHSEKLTDQQRSLAEFGALADQNISQFAQAHHDQILRFGRFPGRNAALGRRSTEVEQGLIDEGATF